VFDLVGLAGFLAAGRGRCPHAFASQRLYLLHRAEPPALRGHDWWLPDGYPSGWRKVMGIEPIAAPVERPSALKAGRVTRPEHLPSASITLAAAGRHSRLADAMKMKN